MQKYRKKPVVIEAIQYDGTVQDIVDFVGLENTEMNEEMTKLYIKTLEGNMLVSHGDYVIKGVKGEFYPCKPDIFKKTYEEYNGDDKKANTVINIVYSETKELIASISDNDVIVKNGYEVIESKQ